MKVFLVNGSPRVALQAGADLEKKFESEVEARKAAKAAKRPYGDPSVIAQQNSMPEKLRIKPGPVSQQEMAVYDEFASSVLFRCQPTDTLPRLSGFFLNSEH